MTTREQTRWTKGPIRIGDRCLIGFGCLFLDGVGAKRRPMINSATRLEA